LTKFNLNNHLPAIDSTRASLLEAPLELQTLGLGLQVNPALVTPHYL